MKSSFDLKAPKKATNLTINGDLLKQAKELGINLSRTFEKHLEEQVRQAHREKWLAENWQALEDYNNRVDRDGVFSDGLRRF